MGAGNTLTLTERRDSRLHLLTPHISRDLKFTLYPRRSFQNNLCDIGFIFISFVENMNILDLNHKKEFLSNFRQLTFSF